MFTEKFITYKLCGDSLQTAFEIHEQEKIANEDFKELQQKMSDYRMQLLEEYDQKHTPIFNELIQKLGDQLSIPAEDLVEYRLDAGYLEDHGIAFLKHYPKGADSRGSF